MEEFNKVSKEKISLQDEHGFPTVSCSENPRDLNQAITVLEDKLRQEVKTNGPTVVLISEIHHYISHVAMNQLIAEKLTRSNSPLSVAMGIERPSDLFEKMLEDTFGDEYDEDQRREIAANDPHGQNMLALYRETQMVPGAPITRRNGLEFFRQNSLSVRAVDSLSTDDHNGQGSQSIYGLGRRNLTVAENVFQHLNDTGAEVYILGYGGAHLVGLNGQASRGEGDRELLPYPFETSLYSTLTNQGLNVLPVLMDGSPLFGMHSLPEDGKSVFKNGLTIYGADQSIGYQNPDLEYDSDERIEAREAEISIFERFAKQNGLTIYPEHEFMPAQENKLEMMSSSIS